ncbi:hypothetical protein JXA34_01820 [Patescibacteria group bacterium]|nr:hypothetical protein [Patescibacteria group bacterium]
MNQDDRKEEVDKFFERHPELERFALTESQTKTIEVYVREILEEKFKKVFLNGIGYALAKFKEESKG